MRKVLWCCLLFLLIGCTAERETRRYAGDSPIQITEKARLKLGLFYRAYNVRMRTEFAFCVYGQAEDAQLFITDVELPPQMHEQNSVRSPRYYLCRPGRVAWGHSHYFRGFSLSKSGKAELLARPERYVVLIKRNQHNELVLRVWTKASGRAERIMFLAQRNLDRIPSFNR